MKIVFFVRHGKPTLSERSVFEKLKSEQHKVYFSNGSVLYGFEDSCDAVYLSADFPHVEKWAVSKGIEVMKLAVAVEPEPVKEIKTDADALSEDSEKQEEKAEEEVKPRRQRRTKPAADDVV